MNDDKDTDPVIVSLKLQYKKNDQLIRKQYMIDSLQILALILVLMAISYVFEALL